MTDSKSKARWSNGIIGAKNLLHGASPKPRVGRIMMPIVMTLKAEPPMLCEILHKYEHSKTIPKSKLAQPIMTRLQTISDHTRTTSNGWPKCSFLLPYCQINVKINLTINGQ